MADAGSTDPRPGHPADDLPPSRFGAGYTVGGQPVPEYELPPAAPYPGQPTAYRPADPYGPPGVSYGVPQSPPTVSYNVYGQIPGYPSAGSNNGLAIGSLVSSLLSLPLSLFCFLGLIGSIAGIVLGIVAINQVKQTQQQGRGLAIAGIVVGGATFAIYAVLAIFFFGLIGIGAF